MVDAQEHANKQHDKLESKVVVAQSLQASPVSGAVQIKPLPYPLNGLEPIMSEHQLTIHYEKHHKTYVEKLNAAIEESKAAADTNPQKLVELSQAIKFNGGGHYNHEFFWESLKPIQEGGGNLPDANGPPNSKLAKMILTEYGSLDALIEYFNAKAVAV